MRLAVITSESVAKEALLFHNGGTGDPLFTGAVHTAGLFAFTATVLSVITIWSHLKNYRKPHLQRFVLRIIIMVPIYALSSWISLVSLDVAFYLDAIREIYEAFVIYCFFNLLINYLGGERSLLILLHGRAPTPHLAPVNFFCKEMDVGDPYSFLFLKRGILQYVYVKPFLTGVTLVLKYLETYHDGMIGIESGYLWVSLVYNVSCSWTLYCLAMFYMCTKDDLKPYRPIPKFLCVKAVIFFSFWQGFAISLLLWMGVLQPKGSYSAEHISVAFQDFLICIEMVFAAVAHWYAFSYLDYYDANVQSARMPIKYALKDFLGMKDVIEDTLETLRGSRFNYRTFEPAEGMAYNGASRTSRIMAGLRYASGGASKYWVDEPNPRNPLFGRDAEADQYSLNFPDQLDEDVESMYERSRKLGNHGDYNFPVIDGNYPRVAATASTLASSNKGKGRRKETLSRKKSINNTKPQEIFFDDPDDSDEISEDNFPKRNSESKKSRQISDVIPPYRPGCVDLVKEVKDRNGKHFESYVSTIEKIINPHLSSSNQTPVMDPFFIGVRLPPNVPVQSQLGGNNSNHKLRSNGYVHTTTNASTSHAKINDSLDITPSYTPFKSFASKTASKNLPIKNSLIDSEKKFMDTNGVEGDQDEYQDPLRSQSYFSQSVRSLEQNMWKDNVWE